MVGHGKPHSATSHLVTLLHSSFFAFSADFITRAVATILFIGISRSLGTGEAGIYSLAVTFLFIFTRFSLWGLDQLLTREVAKDFKKAGLFLVNFLFLRFILSFSAVLALWATIKVLGYSPHTARVILLLGLSILPMNITNLGSAMFMAYQKMGYLTLTALVVGLARLTVGVACLWRQAPLEQLALALAVVNLFEMIFNLSLVLSRFVRPVWRINPAFCLEQLRIALPFILIGGFFILDNRLDTVLLSLFETESEVGIYSAANTVVGALALIPQAYRIAVFPMMSRFFAVSQPTLRRLYEWSFKYMLIASLPLAAIITYVARPLILLVFKTLFVSSVPALQVLGWSLVFAFPIVLNSRLLVASDKQRVLVLLLASSLAVNAVLNLVLIPRLSFLGVAMARVVSTALLFSLGYRYVHRNFEIDCLQYARQPAVATMAMATVLFISQGLSPWLAVGFGVLVYVLALLLLDTFSQEDRELIAGLLWRGWSGRLGRVLRSMIGLK